MRLKLISCAILALALVPGKLHAIPDTSCTIDGHDLTIMRHVAQGPVAITNALADARLAGATIVINTADTAVDVACCVQLQRLNPVGLFPASLAGGQFNNITTDPDLLMVLNDPTTDVKVVTSAVGVCGAAGAIAGCANTPGTDFLIAGNSVQGTFGWEDIVWAHEFGHNQSLNHVPDVNRVMNATAFVTARGLIQSECNVMHGAAPAGHSPPDIILGNCNPPVPEACCFADGTCQDLLPTSCAAQGGAPQGCMTLCATTQCPQPNEACCFPDGTCNDVPPTTCSGMGGTPQGPGTTCAGTICIALEACCFPGPAPVCADMPAFDCQLAGGMPQGPGTSCATTLCKVSVPKFSQPPTDNRDDIPSNIDLQTMTPNIVVADDFQSDGRPITCVRWWGSYIDPSYQPVQFGGMPSPFEIDGWLISFHEPLAADPTGTTPPQPPLGLYFAETADVSIVPTSIPSCDGHVVYQYTVEIIRCCLLHFMPDSRSGWVPAQFEAFEEEHCFVYDIDIEAVVGMSYERDFQTGMCIPVPSQNIGQGSDFWGWHSTDIENGNRNALMSVVTMNGPQWLYGPWIDAQPVCAPPPVNMAFELMTNEINIPPECTEACCLPDGTCVDMLVTDCQAAGGTPQGPGSDCSTADCKVVVPKFEQYPTADREDIPSNIDFQVGTPNLVVADDFQSDGRPITCVQWWGSYLDPRFMPAAFGGDPSPFEIDGWLISFHEPLVEDPSGMPEPLLGLYFCRAEDVQIRITNIPACDGHPVFEYIVELDKCCLIHSNEDSRSGLFPAQPDAFREEHCFWYDLDIQAVVGVEFQEDIGTGECIPVPTQNMSEGFDFWGWHSTDNENGQRPALMSFVSMGPLGEWLYGPWIFAPPTCAPPPVNMSFVLMTDDPVVPPECTCDCPGDMDGSGVIDGLDVQGFVDCLLGVAALDCTCADMDGMNGPDVNDIPLFITALLNKVPCP